MKINLFEHIKIETPRWIDAALLLVVLALVGPIVGLAKWIAFSIIGLVSLIGIAWLLYHRYRQIHPQGQQELIAAGVGMDSYDIIELLGFYAYQGFKWEVTRKRDRRRNGSVTSPDAIWTVGPPRCPMCETELKEQKSFCPGLFIWRCVHGHYKKRRRNSFETVREDVRRGVRAGLERNPRWPRT